MGFLKNKDLIGLADLEKEDIGLILQHAKSFREVLNRPIKKVPTLRDVTIATTITIIRMLYSFNCRFFK